MFRVSGYEQRGPASSNSNGNRRPCYLSIDFEDYAHDFQRALGVREPRTAPESLWRSLEILEDFSHRCLGGARLTFFTTGQLARDYPDLVRQIAASGHEVACHYYEHDQIWHEGRTAFRRNLHLAIEALSRASSQEIQGFRAPDFSIDERCADWAYEELSHLFTYDSSFVTDEAVPDAIQPWLFDFGDTQLYEFPIWQRQLAKSLNVRVIGGSYFRLLPLGVVTRLLHESLNSGFIPQVYLHPYDILHGREQWSRFADLRGLRPQSRLYWWLRQHQWHSIGNRTALWKLEHVYKQFYHPGTLAEAVAEHANASSKTEAGSALQPQIISRKKRFLRNGQTEFPVRGGTPLATAARSRTQLAKAPRILVVGGEDHHHRLPFLLQLRARGFDIAAAGTGDPTPFRDSGIEYFSYRFDRFMNPLSDVRAVSQIRDIITGFEPQIVQTFDTKPGILAPLAARHSASTRVVRTINGLGWAFSSPSAAARSLRPVFNLLHKVTAPYTSVTVFQNSSDLAHFERAKIIGANAPSRLILGSGVDVTAFTGLDRSSRERLRRELGLGIAPVVITVTRLSTIKGIPELLQAAERIHAERPDVIFLLVGAYETEGKHAVTPRELAPYAPYVKALGARDDVPALLNLADVFAFPTKLYEGVPRVLLEAAMAQLPIVTTDMPGCTDIVQDGARGLIVPPRCSHSLAAGITFMLDHPARARMMADKAREHVKAHFSLDVVVNAYMEVYESLLRHSVSCADSTETDREARGLLASWRARILLATANLSPLWMEPAAIFV